MSAQFFQGLSKKKYLAYLHSLPDFRQEKNQTYLILTLTIFAFSFFGIFAISPTLSTIGQLRKNIADSKFVDQQLQTKITNMTLLENQYGALSAQLPMLLQAIPTTPDVPTLLAQVRGLAQGKGVTITQVSTEPVTLATQQKASAKLQSFALTISASGEYPQLLSFYQGLINMHRLITLDSLTIIRPKEEGGLRLTVRILAYFKP